MLQPQPFSSPSSPSHTSDSPTGTAKLKLQPSPCPSLRRALLWGEKAGTSLGLSIAGGSGAGYALYESHVGEHVPLERIRRGPDGRFVVESTEKLPPQQDPPSARLQETEPIWHKEVALRPRPPGNPPVPSGRRRGRYFGYGSSSPVDEGAALCILDVSPVASPATLPYSPDPPSDRWDSLPPLGSPPDSGTPQRTASPPPQSSILQYLSLPFFKEMCVDGDWPPPEEPQQPPAPPQQQPDGGQDCVDPCAKLPPAPTLLQPPKVPLGPIKASLPGPPVWPTPPEPTRRAPPMDKTESREVPPPEKLPRGSLTSQSSGRGSASFLRPPSLTASLGGPGPGTPPGDGGSWKVGTEPVPNMGGKR